MTTIGCFAKINSTIFFVRCIIYKSMLVSRLNGNQFLSKDRMTWIMHSIHFNDHDDYLTVAASSITCLLGIELSCSFYWSNARQHHFLYCEVSREEEEG